MDIDLAAQAVREWEKCGRNQIKAAKSLKIPRGTFQARLRAGLNGHRIVKRDPADIVVPTEAIENNREKRDAKHWKKKYETTLTELELSEKRLQISDTLGFAKPRQIQKETGENPTASTAIIVMTDWHAEEDIDPETCNGLNKFDPAVCERRVQSAFRKSLELIEAWSRTWPIDEIYLALLGDFITGYIHDELEESNHLSPSGALLLVEQLLVDGIQFLLKESKVKRLVIPTCYGNHGRTTQKRRIKTGHKNSYEWLLYKFMERRAFPKDPRVEFRIADGYHNICEIRGRIVRLHHGDNIRYQGGVGGLSIPTNKAIAAWNKSIRADLDLFGHWHQFIDDWRWVSCGCLCGYSDFSVSIKADYQEPTQTVVLVNRKYGKVAALPVFVE